MFVSRNWTARREAVPTSLGSRLVVDLFNFKGVRSVMTPLIRCRMCACPLEGEAGITETETTQSVAFQNQNSSGAAVHNFVFRLKLRPACGCQWFVLILCRRHVDFMCICLPKLPLHTSYILFSVWYNKHALSSDTVYRMSTLSWKRNHTLYPFGLLVLNLQNR